jgi:DNA-binding GntR family transcriptional regulator
LARQLTSQTEHLHGCSLGELAHDLLKREILEGGFPPGSQWLELLAMERLANRGLSQGEIEKPEATIRELDSALVQGDMASWAQPISRSIVR